MKPTTTKVAVILHTDDKPLNVSLDVDEIYVYTDTPEKVETGKTFPLNAMCIGDLFRHLDTTGIIKNDFIFMASNLTYELDMTVIYNQHLDLRKSQKPQLVMTLIMVPSKQSGNGIHIYKDKELLHFSPHSEYIQLPSVVSDFVVRSDLHHVMGMICSADVPLLFTENFDYQSMDDFIKGILESELLDKQFEMIHAGKFCIQDKNLITKNIITQHDKLKNAKHLRDYLIPSIVGSAIPKSVLVDWHSTILDSKIGENCRIQKSILHKCTIGNGCILIDAHVDVGATIGDGVKLQNCFIESNAIINADVTDTTIYANQKHNEPNKNGNLKELELYRSMIKKSNRSDSVSRLLQDDTQEIKDTIYRLINENGSFDNVKIELRTLRMSLTASFDKMRSGIIGILSPKCFINDKYLHLLTLLKDFTHTVPDEFHVLYELVKDMEKNEIDPKKLAQVIKLLWDADVLNNSLFEWIELKPSTDDAYARDLIEATKTKTYFKQACDVVKEWEQQESSTEEEDTDDSDSASESD